jgi:hypothetical protein
LRDLGITSYVTWLLRRVKHGNSHHLEKHDCHHNGYRPRSAGASLEPLLVSLHQLFVLESAPLFPSYLDNKLPTANAIYQTSKVTYHLFSCTLKWHYVVEEYMHMRFIYRSYGWCIALYQLYVAVCRDRRGAHIVAFYTSHLLVVVIVACE